MSDDTRLGALDRVLDERGGTAGLGADLFAVVDTLDSSVALRRALTDPSMPPDGRRRLAHGILDDRMSPEAVDLVAEAAALRWPSGRDLAAAIERQGVRAELAEADRTGTLADTEDALFRFARQVETTPEVRNALADHRVPIGHRQRLVDDLLGGKVGTATLTLARRAVRARERTFAATIEGYVALAAAQRNRVLATVRVARPLTEQQTERLRTALSRQAGREVGLQVVVDPAVLGGVQVELGDEIVEGTVGGRLAEVQRLFS